MKLMIFLTCICLHVSANVYPQKVSLNLKSVVLKSVLKEIETQTEVRFVYSSEFLKDKTTINVDVKEQPVESVLNKVLSGTEFSYSKSNDQLYVISPRQDLVITGIVKNEIGEPLSGATIHLKQSNSVTSTDADGKFTLKIPSSGGVLTVTYLGYVVYSIPVSTSQNLVIQLQPNDDNNLDEVVVVGYGTQKKATVTGSVAQVSGKEIVKSPVANISNSLQGRLPGLQFRQTSGEPGGDAANINIRGLGNALTIVDGVPTDINQINPNDIESISILKDGAAAMYGFRAANGAIIITTKRGNLTKPIFSLDAYAGYQANAVLYPQLLNAGQFTELMNESTINSANANSPTAVLPTLPFQKEEVEKWKQGTLPGYENTDWYNLVFNDYAPQNSVNLSIRGGSESAKYFISGGHLSQKGTIKSDNSNFTRSNLRSNVDFKINKYLNASLNLSGRVEHRNSPPARITGNDSDILQTIARVYPIYKPYANNDPMYYGTTNIPSANPLAMSSENGGYNKSSWGVFNASGILEYTLPFVVGLSAKANFNYEYVNHNSKNWIKQYFLYSYNESSSSYEAINNVNNPTRLSHDNSQRGIPVDLQLSLNYQHTFNDVHNIKGLFLLHKTKKNGFGYYVNRNFTLDALDQLSKGDVLNQGLGESTNYQEAYLGYAGRVNYDFKGKYLAEVSARYDYSWKFPNQAGLFPAFSAGWVISNESFFNVSLINNLKIKGSWAKMPDDDGFSGFNYLSGYNYPSGSYLFTSGTPLNGLRIGAYANHDLSWMVGKLYNLGLEVGLFDNMLTGELNVFQRNRTGLKATVQATYPSVSGINPPEANLNEDNTRGFEVELGFNKKFGNVNMNVSPNFAYSRSMNGFQINPPAGSAWSNYIDKRTDRWKSIELGYVALGQFSSLDEINTSPIQDGRANQTLKPGDIKYKDINSDGVINDDDREFISRGNFPQIQFGLNLALTYKSFDFSALFAGAAHFNVSYSAELQRPFFNGANAFDFFMDRWRREDIYDPTSPWIEGKYPSTISGGSENNNKYSTFWVKKGDYVRLKNLVLGYTLPKTILNKVGIQSARIYASGQNLFILSHIENIDPEAFSNASRGGYYPIQKVYSFGLNIGF